MERSPLPLTFRHWAGITPYTSPSGFSRELWFWYPVARAWTLRLPRAPPARGFTLHAAPLLPKVRGQFAEFLNRGSLVHLGLLDLSTCVGLRYGRGWSPEPAFRGCTGASPLAVGSPTPFHSPLGQRRTDFLRPAPYRLGRRSSRRGDYPSASGIGQATTPRYRTIHLLSIGSGRGRPLRPDYPAAVHPCGRTL